MLEIDFETLEDLCRIQCTMEEIASFFRVSDTTIHRRCHEHYGCSFEVIYKKHSAGGKISLRRSQMRMAESVPAMAIWLGKQYLGQTEKVEQKVDAEVRPRLNIPESDERSAPHDAG